MENINTKKIDDYTLEVTKQPITPESIVAIYDRVFIYNQIVQIQKQKDDYIEARDKELQECKYILTEMDRLGIISDISNELK